MGATDLLDQLQSADFEETEETVPESTFVDDGVLLTVGRVAVLIMGATLTPRIRKRLRAWMQNAFKQGSFVKADFPLPGEVEAGRVELRPGSRKISAFACGDTISKPN